MKIPSEPHPPMIHPEGDAATPKSFVAPTVASSVSSGITVWPSTRRSGDRRVNMSVALGVLGESQRSPISLSVAAILTIHAPASGSASSQRTASALMFTHSLQADVSIVQPPEKTFGEIVAVPEM